MKLAFEQQAKESAKAFDVFDLPEYGVGTIPGSGGE
jgi:hypothetical protein